MAGGIAGAIFLLGVLFYGNQQIAHSLLNEVVSKSWEYQRLSALSPWSLTWGKVFGPLLFPWALGWSAFALNRLFESGRDSLYLPVVPVVLFVLTSHAVVLLVSLLLIRNGSSRRYPVSRYANLFALLFPLLAWGILLTLENLSKGPGSVWSREEVSWFGVSYELESVLTVTLLITCAWAWTGAWRAMSRELQVKQRPWAWPLFLLTVVVGLGGFQESVALAVFQGFLLCGFFFYLNLFSEEKDLLLFRRLRRSAGLKNWAMFWEILPNWVVSLFFVMILAAVSVLVNFGESENWLNRNMFVVSSLIFLMRDLALVVFINMWANHARRDSASVFAMALLYVFIPILVALVDQGNAPSIYILFYPLVQGQSLVGLLMPLVEAVIAWQYAVSRYRRLCREAEVPGGEARETGCEVTVG
ncbi:MAG: hypothetical protein HQL59_13065 [Magnetococcales bacterium]|nr:hypothetical protein [Magnetococcales bacterium]